MDKQSEENQGTKRLPNETKAKSTRLDLITISFCNILCRLKLLKIHISNSWKQKFFNLKYKTNNYKFLEY